MAARALARPPFTIADLAAETTIAPEGVTLVEGAGGLRSPLADDGDNVALVTVLDPALVILVADAGLGTINAVRLSAAALRPRPYVVYLNRFTPATDTHLRNLDWLRERDDEDVATDVDALTDQVMRRAR
jgi:dethiobiotin synthetase